MKTYNKQELLKKIELLSEEAQRCLCDLLCNRFYNFPIEYKETPAIIELESCNFIYRAIKQIDFQELSILELEYCLHKFGMKIESEMDKKMLIALIFENSEKILENFIPVINFNLQRNILKYLCNKFQISIE